jgi:hypothetical protein
VDQQTGEAACHSAHCVQAVAAKRVAQVGTKKPTWQKESAKKSKEADCKERSKERQIV